MTESRTLDTVTFTYIGPEQHHRIGSATFDRNVATAVTDQAIISEARKHPEMEEHGPDGRQRPANAPPAAGVRPVPEPSVDRHVEDRAPHRTEPMHLEPHDRDPSPPLSDPNTPPNFLGAPAPKPATAPKRK